MKTLSEFQSYLSESFYRKIHLLEKIIGDRHWLTTGVFKEKILLNFLSKTLPKKLNAKSGFVAFPCEKKFTGSTPKKFDEINSSSYEISKQIDIIIYDQINFAPIYSDSDIVICCPESVIGIIEVKGVLNNKHLNDAIMTLNDYTERWLRYKKFRDNHHIESNLPKTNLYVFAWEMKVRKDKVQMSGKSVLNILANNLLKVSSPANYNDIPKIDKVFVYNEYEISFLFNLENEKCSDGYFLSRGKYVNFDEKGNPKLGEDKTIYSLLRDILWSDNSLHNRFLIDADESGFDDIFPPKDSGYLKVYDVKP